MDPENMLKDRMAESLVEELLKQCGNKVYRFGYEAVLQNLTQLEERFDRESEVGQRIRSIPDFIVVNKKNISLVEIKFRSRLNPDDWENNRNMLQMIENFWRAKIIWITLDKPYFMVSVSPYFNAKGDLNLIPIEKDSDLGVGTDILKEFNELVEKYFLKEKSRK